nr:probable serine/threonine protein kinase IREH1 isoform X1 [Tanacetum cinerariifolium]
DDRSQSYLLECVEDLKVVTERIKFDALTVETFGVLIEKLIRKFDALTVETFGVLIEKLIREKYMQLFEFFDDEIIDITSTVIDEDAPLEDDVVRSLRASLLHSPKDLTPIDDFEIIKPISHGAFGQVF